MGRLSAGLVVYRVTPPSGAAVEVLLVHPGGPYWAGKDERAWSIPKGEVGPDEDPWGTATREFAEELGHPPPTGPALDLGEVTQAGGKRVRAWALAGDLDVAAVESNTFELEWPPRSGTTQRFPEVDRAGWFGPAEARVKLIAAQAQLVDRLLERLHRDGEGGVLDPAVDLEDLPRDPRRGG